MNVINELIKSLALADDAKLNLLDIPLNGLQLLFALKIRISCQSDRDSELLSRVLDEHLASSAQRIHDVVGDVKIRLSLGSIGFLITVSDVLGDALSGLNGLFEVLSEEHEHVLWSLDLLTNIDHEQQVLLTQLHPNLLVPDSSQMALAIILVKGSIFFSAIINVLDVHQVVLQISEELFFLTSVKATLKLFNF